MAGESGSGEGEGSFQGAVQFSVDYTAAREMSIRAGRYVRRARDLHVFLDYSDTSVEAADTFGHELWSMLPGGLLPDEAEQLRQRLIDDLGAYFGETFIRNHGGTWGWADIGGRRVWSLRTSSGYTAFPAQTASKRLRHQEPGNLSALYEFLVRQPQVSRRATRRTRK